MTLPTVPEIDTAPRERLARWWRTLPEPTTDEERDLIERLAVRCEGLGMVDGQGLLKG